MSVYLTRYTKGTNTFGFTRYVGLYNIIFIIIYMFGLIFTFYIVSSQILIYLESYVPNEFLCMTTYMY